MRKKLADLGEALEAAAVRAKAAGLEGVAVQLRTMATQYCDLPEPEVLTDDRGKPLAHELQPGGEFHKG